MYIYSIRIYVVLYFIHLKLIYIYIYKYIYANILRQSPPPECVWVRLEKHQRSGAQLSEGLASAGLKGGDWGPSWNSSNITPLWYRYVFKRPLNWAPVMLRDDLIYLFFLLFSVRRLRPSTLQSWGSYTSRHNGDLIEGPLDHFDTIVLWCSRGFRGWLYLDPHVADRR